ncbi:PilZ domain-containing protein [Candidatus Sumerlaeota bacterium]|nr:PilZ domain-containing protein [Candidatus Sumerlaeota bacterium]
MSTMPQMKDVKRFLAGLNRNELAEIREYVDALLKELRANNRGEPSKRPHVAMPERRQGDRYELDFPGKCWNAMCESDADRDEVPMSIIDISHTGCRLLSNELFPPGALLVLEFCAPSGENKRIIVEVARAQETGEFEGWRYEMGCRTVAEGQADQAEEDIARQKSVRKQLAHHPGIRVLLLAKGPGSVRVEKWLKAEKYNIEAVSTPDELLSGAESRPPHLLVAPFADVQKGKNKWFRRFLQDASDAATIVVAPNAKEGKRARLLHGADEVVLASKIETEIPLAVERALLARFLCKEQKMKKFSVKVLVAGPEEKQLRRLETLLLQEDYLIVKSLTQEDMFRQLVFQKIDILIADPSMLERDGEDQIPFIHESEPQLVVVAETAVPRTAQSLLDVGVDLVLSPTASRNELLERLEQAYRVHLRRTFVK